MEALLQLNAVPSITNLKGLQRLYDTVESHVRGLKSLGISAESYGSLLSSVLINKLPTEFQLIVSHTVTGDNWELDRLLQTVETEISARERSGTVSAQRTPQAQKSVPSVAFMSDNNSSNTSCVYCKESHTLSFCRKVNNLEARKDMLKSSGRCFICLQKGHLAFNCRSGKRCYHCKGRHHGSICSAHEGPMTSSKTLAHESPVVSDTSVNNIELAMTQNTPVFLQTANIMVYNPERPDVTMKARLILDSGSQRSYASEHIKRTLS